VDLFSELLEEVIDGGHRVLVFSQFVTMLHLLRDKLKSEEIDFCYLDGSTSNRGEVVQQFQTGQRPRVPHQPQSRRRRPQPHRGGHRHPFRSVVESRRRRSGQRPRHRIGQTRVVTSYKLITRGTVEEKILALQNRKREIIRATLGGEEALAEALTWEEIQELFST
jgi:SNF2 family DNA or RNA helicase